MIPIVCFLDHSPTRRVNHLEKREKLGLSPAPKAQSRTREPLQESADAYQRVEVSTSLFSLVFFSFSGTVLYSCYEIKGPVLRFLDYKQFSKGFI